MATPAKEVAAESAKPMAPTKRPAPPHPFVKLCANRVKVVVQQKGGNIIKGTAKWYRANWLKLENVEIIGKEHQVNVPWILLEHQAIAHLHPDGNPVTASEVAVSEE